MDSKQPKALHTSKTMVINLTLLLIAMVPDVQIFFREMGWSVAWVVGALAALNMVLRMSTKGPVAMRLAVLRQGVRWLTGREPK